jgi:hypothetical protein
MPDIGSFLAGKSMRGSPAIPNTGVRAAVKMFEEGDFAHYPVV